MNRTWQALQQEASMAAEHLAIGVTALGRANYVHKAYYYQAFFALGVGLERSAKVALVVDYALDNSGRYPPEENFRRYGHDLSALLENTDRMAEKRNLLRKENRLPHSTIHKGIIGVLTDFANNITRYYNLNLIVTHQHKEKAEEISGEKDSPIKAWFERVTLPVLKFHYKPHHQMRDERNAKIMNHLYENMAFVRYHAENGSAIDSPGKASMHMALTKFAVRYTRMYTMQIFRFVGTTLSELGSIANQQGSEDIPYFNEMFLKYDATDAYFKSRKTWSIYREE